MWLRIHLCVQRRGQARLSGPQHMSPQSCFQGLQNLQVKGRYILHLLKLWLIEAGLFHSSDIWAIGCILYFLMVGQSPFLALNDYLSFKKIEALDFTFLEGFDQDARDLVQRLLVSFLCWSKPCLADCPFQVLDPSDRLGVPPKSSLPDLREHAFFVGHGASTSGDHPASYINWDTLWSDPSPIIEPGLVQVTPQRQEDKFSWGGFVTEFSLVADDEDAPLDRQDHEEHAADVAADQPSNFTNGEPPVLPLAYPSIPTPASPIASTSRSSTTDSHNRIVNSDITSPLPTSDFNLLGSIDSWFVPPPLISIYGLHHNCFIQVVHFDTLRDCSFSDTSGDPVSPSPYPKDSTSAPCPHLAPPPVMCQTSEEQHGHSDACHIAPFDCQGRVYASCWRCHYGSSTEEPDHGR